jgi:hypothetical protein
MKGYAWQCDVCKKVEFIDKMPSVSRPPEGWIKVLVGPDEGEIVPTVEICSVTCLMNSHDVMYERGVWI